jgi:hypothetical protein
MSTEPYTPATDVPLATIQEHIDEGAAKIVATKIDGGIADLTAAEAHYLRTYPELAEDALAAAIIRQNHES